MKYLKFTLLLLFAHNLQSQSGYQLPPRDMIDIVDAPSPPSVYMSPDKSLITYAHRSPLPSIEDLSQPELRIGGLRINPAIFDRSRRRPFNQITFQKSNEKMERGIKNLPASLKAQHLTWSPDSKHLALTHMSATGLELWTVDLNTFTARKYEDILLNGTLGSPIEWIDNKSLVVRTTIYDPAEVPAKPIVPKGPTIKENLGIKAPVRTYQDMLKNEYDETVFEFYTQSQLMKVGLDGSQTKLGEPSIYYDVSPSPDGLMIMVKRIQKPFSYIVPYYRFPMDVEILNLSGETTKTIARIPIQEKRPKGFDATQAGPRGHQWRNDQPNSLYFVVALDEGDPKKEVTHRDAIYSISAPFDDEPKELYKTTRRFRDITFSTGSLAWVEEIWWTSRNQIINLVDLSGQATPKELVNRSTQDRYSDPGDPILAINDYGRLVLDLSKGNSIYLTGAGASPKGDEPFIDELNTNTLEKSRLWQSKAPYYEIPIALMDTKKGLWLTRRESPEENPNFYLQNIKRNKTTQLTSYAHPYPNLKGVKKEMIQYKREDGLTLNAELYLPANYKKEDGPLPTFIWAYPREYKNKSDAGQVSGSPYRFKSMSFYGPIPWVTQGYAVLNNASMPIIGEGDDEPNDSFREQLVANAKAAINECVSRGVTDPDRVGIGGHSYGAFMTANVLAHSDLFAAGIARSGAYNRTLTPFGFQREERTYWEAPDLYNYMSPFMHAEKVNEPILLIHGEADNNSGTFPIQSERYYHALKGHGAVARYVTLPNESHGYRARESVLHMLFEMNNWMDTFVKNAPKQSTKEVKTP